MRVHPERLEIRLLGSVEIMVDGVQLEVDTRKAVAMLSYLAVVGRPQSRDHLADLFWPDTDPDHARAAFRRTLSALRSRLGESWVFADRSAVRFTPDEHVTFDVESFRAEADEYHQHGSDAVCEKCIETLGAAARRYRGSFMDGFSLRGCPAFDDWMMLEDEHVRRRAALVFERLSTALAAEGRYNEAIDSVRRWLAVDPLHERAHRSAMLLHAWSGDRSGSVDAYRACVAVLDRELGVEPLEETTELYEAILEEDLPRAPAPRPAMSVVPTPITGYPLVGRHDAFDRLNRVISKGAGMVVLEGEMGVGKTRMLEEIARQLKESGTTMLVGTANRTEAGVAYGPIQSMLTEAVERSGVSERIGRLAPTVLNEAARLLPSLGAAPAVDPLDPSARTRFIEALSQVIGAIGDRVVLALDNLHWVDGATLELIGYLARRLDRLGIVLIVTRRPEDTPIDHPVSLVLDDLTTHATVISLECLTAEAVDELVDFAEIEGMVSQHVHLKTRGLPFFVIEYLESARAGLTELPVAVHRLLASRLSEIGPMARQLSSTAAVLGVPADIETITAVSGRSEDEVMAGLDELIHRSILRDSDDGTADFVHDQMRQVVYSETTLLRRRLLHKRAARHLLTGHGAESDARLVAAAARHHRLAGNDEEAARLSETAARLAASVFAFDEAVSHLATALALGHANRAAIHQHIGDLSTLAGKYGPALAAYDTALAELPKGSLQRGVVAHSAGEVHRRLRRWDLASSCFGEAWEAAPEPIMRSRVAADWAFVEHKRGDTQRAHTLANTALETARASGASDTLAHAYNIAGLLADEPVTRIEHLTRALEHAQGPVARSAVLNNLALTLAAVGDITTAIDHARQALELSHASGDRHRTAALHDNLADFLHTAGEEEESMAELKHAVELFADIGVEPGDLEPEIWLLKEW